MRPVDDRLIVAVVLAAGAGRRFDGAGHKLDAVVGGSTVLARAIDHARAASIGPVVVVTPGPGARPLPTAVDEVVNEAWADGQSTSLHAGLTRARSLGAEVAVIGLGDQPGILPAAWRAVAAASAGAAIVVATYGGRRGHPVALRSDTWTLLPTDGDAGARALLRRRPDLVTELPCEGSPFDIDTLEDLRRWQSNSSTSSP